jgi:hypothetical protein
MHIPTYRSALSLNAHNSSLACDARSDGSEGGREGGGHNRELFICPHQKVCARCHYTSWLFERCQKTCVNVGNLIKYKVLHLWAGKSFMPMKKQEFRIHHTQQCTTIHQHCTMIRNGNTTHLLRLPRDTPS